MHGLRRDFETVWSEILTSKLFPLNRKQKGLFVTTHNIENFCIRTGKLCIMTCTRATDSVIPISGRNQSIMLFGQSTVENVHLTSLSLLSSFYVSHFITEVKTAAKSSSWSSLSRTTTALARRVATRIDRVFLALSSQVFWLTAWHFSTRFTSVWASWNS